MTGKLVRIYDEHSEQVNCCHFTNNSNHLLLATGSNDYFLKVSVNENHVDKFDRYIRTSPLIFFFIYCVNQRSFGYRDRNFRISLSNNSKKDVTGSWNWKVWKEPVFRHSWFQMPELHSQALKLLLHLWIPFPFVLTGIFHLYGGKYGYPWLGCAWLL